jgi:RimJ/RimL family protein N-acetyltransferase
MSLDLVTVDRAEIDLLVGAFPFKPFRNYRVFSRARQHAVLRTEIHNALEHPDARALAARVDGALQAAAVFQPLPWDSDYFGLPMARITYLLRRPEASRASLAAAVEASLEYARSIGVIHVTARADVADTDAIGALEEQGFRLMDALVTYVYHPRRDPPAPIKEMGVLREFRPEDTEQIVDITREAYKGFRGRFHLDPHLPDDRCDEMYIEWARKACRFEMADVVLVTENLSGEVHGWMCYRRVEPVSGVGGTAVYGAGLGACRRDRQGAYIGLIRGGIVRAHSLGGVAECQTQNHNFPTVRLYEAVGMQYVRADYTFHAWLG